MTVDYSLKDVVGVDDTKAISQKEIRHCKVFETIVRLTKKKKKYQLQPGVVAYQVKSCPIY